MAREQMTEWPCTPPGPALSLRGAAGAWRAAAGPVLGTWNPLGPGNVGGRTRALVIDPASPNTMYAGGVAGGVWKTTNGGTTWTAEGDELANMAVTTLALRPGSSRHDPRRDRRGLLQRRRGARRGDLPIDGQWRHLDADRAARGRHEERLPFRQQDRVRRREHGLRGHRLGRLPLDQRGGVLEQGLEPRGGRGVGRHSPGGCLDLAVRTDEATLFVSCGTFGFSSTVVRPRRASTGRRTPAMGGTLNWTSYHPLLDGENLGIGHLPHRARMGRTSLAIAPERPGRHLRRGRRRDPDSQTDALWAVYYSDDSGAKLGNPGPRHQPRVARAPCFSPTRHTPGLAPASGRPSFYNQGWYDNTVAVDPRTRDRLGRGHRPLPLRQRRPRLRPRVVLVGRPRESAYTHADQHTIVFHPTTTAPPTSRSSSGTTAGSSRPSPPTDRGTGNNVCVESASGVAFESLNNGYGVTQFYYGTVYPDDKQFLGGTQDNGTIYGSEAAGPNAWVELRGATAVRSRWIPRIPTRLRRVHLRGHPEMRPWAPLAPNRRELRPRAPPASRTAASSSSHPSSWTPRTATSSSPGGPTSGGPEQGRELATGQRGHGGQTAPSAVAPGNPNFALMGTRAGTSTEQRARDLGRQHHVGQGRGPAPAMSPRWLSTPTIRTWPTPPTRPSTTPRTGCPTCTSRQRGRVLDPTLDGRGDRHPRHPRPLHRGRSHHRRAGDARRLYVGTDIGIFVSMDGGATWAQENTQFPNTVTEQLTVSGPTSTRSPTAGGLSGCPSPAAAARPSASICSSSRPPRPRTWERSP